MMLTTKEQWELVYNIFVDGRHCDGCSFSSTSRSGCGRSSRECDLLDARCGDEPEFCPGYDIEIEDMENDI